MIGVLLLWAFTDASAALSVIPLQNPVQVFPGQTAVLPISLRFQNPAWEFYCVKWDFITGHHPVLVYMVDSCTRAPGSQERTCQHRVEPGGFYQQRANISFDSASLVLKAVQPEDAGTYRIIVQSLDVSDTALVNLTVEGALPALSIIIPKNPVRAITNQTARLLFSLQSLNSAWEFIYIKWEFIKGTRHFPILVYMLDNCTGTAHNWWKRTCQLTKEVTKEYQQRADICQNATFVIQGVQAEDAGMYLVTVRTLDVWANATVSLIVTEGKYAWKSLSTINTLRLVFACLVLCILVLTVGEYICAPGSNFTQCEETLGPPTVPDRGAPLVGAAQPIIVDPSTPAFFQDNDQHQMLQRKEENAHSALCMIISSPPACSLSVILRPETGVNHEP